MSVDGTQYLPRHKSEPRRDSRPDLSWIPRAFRVDDLPKLIRSRGARGRVLACNSSSTQDEWTFDTSRALSAAIELLLPGVKIIRAAETVEMLRPLTIS